jgi:hypothetical protein
VPAARAGGDDRAREAQRAIHDGWVPLRVFALQLRSSEQAEGHPIAAGARAQHVVARAERGRHGSGRRTIDLGIDGARHRRDRAELDTGGVGDELGRAEHGRGAGRLDLADPVGEHRGLGRAADAARVQELDRRLE